MSIIADRLKNVKVSPIWTFANKVKTMQANGINTIDLTLGEPDFDTPEDIKSYAKQAIDNGRTKYTPIDGTMELKMAICEKFKTDNNIHYAINEVMASAGVRQVLFNAMGATLNDNDEVIIIAPYWSPYADLISLFGGKPVVVQTKAEEQFKVTAKEIEKMITSKTKWIFLNSPSNPSGSCYNKDELLAIGDLLKRHQNVFLLSDDIYEYMIYDDFKFHTLAELCPELKNRILTANGVSKGYSMTGWRIGYCGIANSELINAMKNIQSQAISCLCSISEDAAYYALKSDKSFLKDWLKQYKERRDYCWDALNKIQYIQCAKPEGAFYLFPCIRDLIGKTYKGHTISNATEFCLLLLEHGHVGCITGEAFGAESHFRISYATSMKLLEEAMHKIKEFCDNII